MVRLLLRDGQDCPGPIHPAEEADEVLPDSLRALSDEWMGLDELLDGLRGHDVSGDLGGFWRPMSGSNRTGQGCMILVDEDLAGRRLLSPATAWIVAEVKVQANDGCAWGA